MAGSVFGIDLGATYAVVARINDLDQPHAVRNANGEDATPAVVFFEDGGHVIVGSEAKAELIANPDDGVAQIKREMGTDHALDFFGQTYTPEMLSALILKELVDAANSEEGTGIAKAVITIPTYFGPREKEATKQAGEIAGLEVVGLIADPVAAVFSVGLGMKSRECLLVLKLGGGTFDSTVLIMDRGEAEIVHCDGNRVLGGADWDSELASLVVQRFVQQAGIPEDPSEDPDFMIEILQEVEKKKMILSKKTETSVRCRYEEHDEKIVITRDDFEAATKQLIDQIVEIAERTVDTAKSLKPGLEIDNVILVGGAGRMPMVDAALRASGWDPIPTDFDLAEAKGAAIYGEMMAGSAFASIPRLSRGLGIRFEQVDGTPYIHYLLRSGDELPISERTIEVGVRVAGAAEVSFDIYEQRDRVGSQMPENNGQRVTLVVTDLPSLPRYAAFELTASVAANGTVRITAHEYSSGRSAGCEFTVPTARGRGQVRNRPKIGPR